MPDGTTGGYPKEWEGKPLTELANEDGTYGKNHSPEEEVELFIYTMRSAFGSVQNEMFKQVAKWGVQDHPSFRIRPEQIIDDGAVDYLNNLPCEHDAKRWCEEEHANGTGTWSDILLEELAEALGAAYKNQDPTGYSIAYPEGTPDIMPDDPKEAEKVAQSIVDCGADDVYYELLQTAAVACAWLTAVLIGRNREVIVKEMEQHKAEQEAYRRMLSKVRAMVVPTGDQNLGNRASDVAAVEDDFTPGGYI